jgi:hypothetical protein
MANGIFRSTTVRVDDAANFVTQFYPSVPTPLASDNHLYCMIGREDNPIGTNPATLSAWPAQAGLWSNDAIPPVPADTLGNDNVFWAMAIGGQLMDPRNIALVCPFGSNTQWATGNTYDKWDINDTALYTNANFYILNSQNEVLMCVQRGGLSLNGPSTVEPKWFVTYTSGGATTIGFDTTTVGSANQNVFNDGTKSILKTTDGYIWKYLYTLTNNEITNILQTNWLPVNFGLNRWGQSFGLLTDPQYTQSQDSVTTSGTNGYAYKILGARYVLITTTLNSGAPGSGVLPYGLNYRQVTLVKNPLSSAGGTPRATFAVGILPNSTEPSGDGTAGHFVVPSGDVIYIENKSPIVRVSSQTELFKAVVSF